MLEENRGNKVCENSVSTCGPCINFSIDLNKEMLTLIVGND